MKTYTVKRGDTLSTIAKKFYEDPGKYILIAEANDIQDPNRIKVGQVLEIPPPIPDISDSTDLMTIQPPELPIDRTTLKLPEGQYIAENKRKDLIVLHFTAGTTARSAFNTWVADARRIATAYIVDVDGVIYETFDPNCWAYALGVKGQPDGSNEKRAIQIEIANVGPLERRDDTLYWWPPNDTYRTRWCHISETHKFVEASYRGRGYYARFPDIQLLAVSSLVKHLCDTFQIQKAIPADRLDVCDREWFSEFRGIVSHQNFRADKYDIGPAFDWQEFEGLIT
jgi:LysM repeat protein